MLSNCYHESSPIGEQIVKRPGLISTWNAGLGCAEGAISFNGKALVVVGGQYGTTTQAPPVFSPGTSWTLYTKPPNAPASNSSFTLEKIPYLTSLGTRLLSVGSSSAFASSHVVYYSDDNGTSWTFVSSVTTTITGSLFRNNPAASSGTLALVILSSGVWGSSNGINWSLLNASPGIGTDALIFHTDGKFYAFGSGVHSSPDGVTWTLKAAAPGWTGKTYFAAWSLGANLYIGAGFPVSRDVWRSTDNGVNWTQIVINPAFTARGMMAFWSYNSKLWIGAGAQNGNLVTTYDDLWNSSDGITWSLVANSFAGIAYAEMPFTVHNGTMYIGNGYVWDGSAKRSRDVDFFAAGASTPAPGTIIMTPFVPVVSSCEPFSFTLIPASGSIPVKVFLKTSLYAWVYDGTTMTQVTDSDYPALTVPGVVYLDGTIYVMNSQGIIFGSDLNDPTSWNALNFITANSEADAAIVLARQLNYVVAFKATSTEFFYDAGNAVGSPLGKVLNALLEIGCGSAGSLAFADNTTYFIANSRQKGRSIMKMEDTGIKVPGISTGALSLDLALGGQGIPAGRVVEVFEDRVLVVDLQHGRTGLA